MNYEKLAYWFFRLNGCLTIENFLVHRRERGQEGGEADILAARFPHRNELGIDGLPMGDHACFQDSFKIDFVLAEVKSSLCKLNGPWTKKERRNIDRLLLAIGPFPKKNLRDISEKLYRQEAYEDETTRVRLFALGNTRNRELGGGVYQLTWQEINRFIFERFTRYQNYKTQHNQWDEAGKFLFRAATSDKRTFENFHAKVISQIDSKVVK